MNIISRRSNRSVIVNAYYECIIEVVNNARVATQCIC